jgi:hypothetical protein
MYFKCFPVIGYSFSQHIVFNIIIIIVVINITVKTSYLLRDLFPLSKGKGKGRPRTGHKYSDLEKIDV